MREENLSSVEIDEIWRKHSNEIRKMRELLRGNPEEEEWIEKPATESGRRILNKILGEDLNFFLTYDRLCEVVKLWLRLVEMEEVRGKNEGGLSNLQKRIIIRAFEWLVESIFTTPYEGEIKTYDCYRPFRETLLTNLRRIDRHLDNYPHFIDTLGMLIAQGINTLGGRVTIDPPKIRREYSRGASKTGRVNKEIEFK